MGSNSFVVAVFLQVFILACLLSYGHGRPKICSGDDCDEVANVLPMLDVLGAYCSEICYGHFADIYNKTCRCDKIVTTAPPPCTTSYLQMAVCDWSTRVCNGSNYCEWRKNMSLSILVDQNMNGSCDCPLKEREMKHPCKWYASEMTLCSVLKVNNLLYSDFRCVCDSFPPTPSPELIDVCAYTKHRDAQLVPPRPKRLFAGSDAYSCNYPGVVGLFTQLGSGRNSVCTATLLRDDTILFDQQCKTALKEPTYALVDSYDTRDVSESSPTVNLTTIRRVDDHSAANALFTAQLKTSLVMDDKCVQPACLPNVRTPAHVIDLKDCRVLGYGDTSDTFITGPQARKLQEIKVKVNPTSVTGDRLHVIRVDGIQNLACLNEFSAPVVCAHKYTHEWITVGIHQYIGVICSGQTKPKQFQVTNLLSEALGNHYYTHLKGFQPPPPMALPQH